MPILTVSLKLQSSALLHRSFRPRKKIRRLLRTHTKASEQCWWLYGSFPTVSWRLSLLVTTLTNLDLRYVSNAIITKLTNLCLVWGLCAYCPFLYCFALVHCCAFRDSFLRMLLVPGQVWNHVLLCQEVTLNTDVLMACNEENASACFCILSINRKAWALRYLNFFLPQFSNAIS